MINPKVISGLLSVRTIGADTDGFTIILAPIVGKDDRIKLSTINGALVLTGLTAEEAQSYKVDGNLSFIIGDQAFASQPEQQAAGQLVGAIKPPAPELLPFAGRTRLTLLEEEPGSNAFTAQFTHSLRPHPECGTQLVMCRVSQADAQGLKPGSEYLVHISPAPPVPVSSLAGIRLPADEAGPYAEDYARIEREQARRMASIVTPGFPQAGECAEDTRTQRDRVERMTSGESGAMP